MRYYIKGHLSMYRKERDSSGEDGKGVCNTEATVASPKGHRNFIYLLQGLFLVNPSHIWAHEDP